MTSSLLLGAAAALVTIAAASLRASVVAAGMVLDVERREDMRDLRTW